LHQQGIYKAPTGSGKTVSVCGLIWETRPQRSIILVDRINLVDQWISSISEHIGIPRDEIGRIGEGGWTEGRITVATVQTIHKNIKRLRREGWFEQFSLMCLDECHHVTADTFLEVVQEFPARVRLGCSATPDKTGIFEVALNTLGEVFYETTHEELRELGILVEPEVRVVATGFRFAYWGDHKADKKGHCQKPGCKTRKPFHGHRNNYNDLKAALVTDEDRAWDIGCEIARDYDNNHQVVITDQTTQIEHLAGLLRVEWPYMNVYTLIGKQTGKQKERLIDELTCMFQSCAASSGRECRSATTSLASRCTCHPS
jgi:superfamily II DNA or RNA helicase